MALQVCFDKILGLYSFVIDMRLPTILACACLFSLLTGCITVPKHHIQEPSQSRTSAPTPQRSGPTVVDIQARFAALPDMLRQICVDPRFSSYFRRTPCLPQMASRNQLNDRTHITPGQIKAMRLAISKIHDLNADTQNMMIQSGIEPYVSLAHRAIQHIDPQVKANQQALIEGQITWGTYNRRRIELADMYKNASETP